MPKPRFPTVEKKEGHSQLILSVHPGTILNLGDDIQLVFGRRKNTTSGLSVLIRAPSTIKIGREKQELVDE